jgi:hypothetical protein
MTRKDNKSTANDDEPIKERNDSIRLLGICTGVCVLIMAARTICLVFSWPEVDRDLQFYQALATTATFVLLNVYVFMIAPEYTDYRQWISTLFRWTYAVICVGNILCLSSSIGSPLVLEWIQFVLQTGSTVVFNSALACLLVHGE